VKLNYSRHLEDYKTQLTTEVEKLKSSLKNSEAFFTRQLEALTKLRTIFRHLVPKKRSSDMDWYEACEVIAESFSMHADALDEFLCLYGAVLPNDVLKKLETATSIATEGTFYFGWNSEAGVTEASREAIQSAEALYENVKDAVADLQKSVDSQVDGRRA
jgi:hypothetical protein